ncbi:winged helix-turn-helix transcriptional regulator [Chryseosolibacter indicus]|uniref:Helix-turn-helix transcriptional regulator n=1 Tax=Chryseosolibacter indicus TaxID=2782351 RepID=A0ABS5VSC0_9BACT|nr:helix-turn-helix domain-containing protein [Chryseosolibacter indicus]MBT1704334.1 helix-turn-helix transcriptional regulator [Chryseosolibacter indicus]
MEKKLGSAAINECSYNLLAIQDTLEILSGKWKVPLICILRLQKKLCFNDLLREVPGISAKVLAKELRELESNDLVARTILDTKPAMVEYRLTEYGNTLEKVIFEMLDWGLSHRKKVTGKDPLNTSSSEYVLQLRKDLPAL